MKASVIVLSWNGMDYLESCLDAVLCQDYPDFEVIVVDNGSTDGSADFVEECYPQVRLVRNEHNLGFAEGCNVGLRTTTGDVLVLLNQDAVVKRGWLAALAGALDREEVGIAGCKILYPDGETIQHAGGWIEWPLGLAHHFGQREQDEGQWDTSRRVEYVTGAAMAFRRDVVERIGFLDREFWPGYFEDADFCLRASRAGYEVWYIPGAVLTHAESASHTSQVFMWESHHRGRLRFVLKHLPPDQFLEQFDQAEELYQPSVIEVFGCRPLSRAYVATIFRVASILRRHWRAGQATIEDVIERFQHLHSLAWEKDWRRAERSIETEFALPAFLGRVNDEAICEEVALPELKEFHFQSDESLVGALASRIRAFWYGIAAKWAIRYLIQQQTVINQQQAMINQQQAAISQTLHRRYARYVEVLEQRLTELVHENALLAKEVADLNMHVRECTPDSLPPRGEDEL